MRAQKTILRFTILLNQREDQTRQFRVLIINKTVSGEMDDPIFAHFIA